MSRTLLLGNVSVRLPVEVVERLATAAEVRGVKWHIAVEEMLRVAQAGAVKAVLDRIEAMAAEAAERMEEQVGEGD